MKVTPNFEKGDARSYTEHDWLKYGDNPNPSTREKMIMLAIEQIIRVGPADFTATQVCDRLDIKHPMISYYFGHRDNFMAEVTWWAYQAWTKSVDRAFLEAPRNPRKRLQAFIENEIAFAQKMGGMQILIQYPLVSGSTQQILSEKHQAEMQKWFEYHLALITICVRDIRKGTVSDFNFTPDTVPRMKILTPPKHFITATQISWATHGLASWSSGQHIATRDIQDPTRPGLTVQYTVNQMVKTILKLAEEG